MKRHPEYGAEFLGSSSFYDVARQVAMHHHERWDGSGYPRGLAGDNIPLAARIVSVADVYDALTSDRPYKVAWPPERALAELLQMRGKSLCPYSVDAFLRLWNNGTIAEIERRAVTPASSSTSASATRRRLRGTSAVRLMSIPRSHRDCETSPFRPRHSVIVARYAARPQ